MDEFFTANAVLSLFSKNYMDLKKGLPIRPSEMGVLNIISETDGPHTPVMLAEMLRVSKPMITAHINSLESKGYVKKEPCAVDKRAYYVTPTDNALNLVERAKADMREQLKRLIDELGKENFDNLVKLCNAANDVIINHKGE